MTTPVGQIHPRFQGLRPGTLLAMMPTWQRRLAKVVNFNESVTGLSMEKFAQSSLVCLLPKLILSRSPIEVAEVTFQELIESAFFYFSIPLMARHAFSPLLQSLTPKSVQLPKGFIQKSFAEIAQKDLPKLLPLKAGLILTSLSMFPMVYSLNFAKNLLTEKVFRKAKFSDVVNLSKGGLKENEESPVAKKAYRRIAQCWTIAGAMILGGVALAAFGHRAPNLQPLLAKAVKYLDLTYEGNKFGLSQTLLIALLWINGYSYIDASRDKLEKVEVATRVFGVSNVVQYPVIDILKGIYINRFNKNSMLLKKTTVPNSIENNLIGKIFGKSGVQLMNAKSAVKTLDELQADSLKWARTELQKQHPLAAITDKMLLGKARPMMEKLVSAKNFLYWCPFAISVVGAGFISGLLNRYWTSVRYQRAVEKENARQAEMKRLLPASYHPVGAILPPSPWVRLPRL